MSNFTEAKGLLRSKGAWGGIISLLPVVGAVAEVAGILPVGTVDETTALVTSAVGGFLALLGRIRAGSKIKGLF